MTLQAPTLTYAEALILCFIHRRRSERALTPRLPEIAVALDLPREETNSAIKSLTELELLEHDPDQPRSVALTPAGELLATRLNRSVPCERETFR